MKFLSRSSRPWLCRALLVAAPIVASSAGCSDSIADQVATMNRTQMQKLFNCYKLYSQNNGLRGPKDEAQLKEFLLGERYKKNLQRMQIDRENLDSLFINERDGKPFKIRYGINGFGDKAVIFEEEGAEGKRFVALQEAREVDSKEYEDLWTGKQRVITAMPEQQVAGDQPQKQQPQ